MRTLPHRPNPTSFPCTKEIATRILKEGESQRAARLKEGDGEFFYTAGHQWLTLGMLGYLYEEPTEKIADGIRKGLRDLRTTLEIGRETNAWEVWDFLCYALAVNDRPFARFLATMPRGLWFSDAIKPVPWLIQQVLAGFALFLELDRKAADLLAQLRVMVFDEELPVELEDELPLIRNACELLEALHRKDPAGFEKHLKTREKLRTDWFTAGGGAAPIALIDLHGLGLGRLARDRKMKFAVPHPYLPWELLEVPPPKQP